MNLIFKISDVRDENWSKSSLKYHKNSSQENGMEHFPFTKIY